MAIDKLIETVTEKVIDSENTMKLCGMLFPYIGLNKRAVGMYAEELEKSNLSVEAKLYYLLNAKKELKQIKNQRTIAEIAINNAIPETDFSRKSMVNEEWLDRFMDSAKFVSQEEIQVIWGKILAKEFEKPGKTPTSMIRILSEITPELALVFKKICGMKILFSEIAETGEPGETNQIVFVPYDKNRESLSKQGVSFSALNELESLGLLRFGHIGGYVLKISGNRVLMLVDDQLEIISGYEENQLLMGNVMLTEVGAALANVIPTEKNLEYFDMVRKYFKLHNIKMEKQTQYKVDMQDGKINIVKID